MELHSEMYGEEKKNDMFLDSALQPGCVHPPCKFQLMILKCPRINRVAKHTILGLLSAYGAPFIHRRLCPLSHCAGNLSAASQCF